MNRETVRRLDELLPGGLPDDVVANFRGVVDAGEPMLALEDLFDDVYLNELTLSQEQADALAAAAADFEITRFSADDVQRLVRG
jgi:hypothetical protein